jgi:hypothetical protein
VGHYTLSVKEPWISYPEIWKTKSAYLSWIRGGIRRSLWNRHPIKIAVLNKQRYKIPNPDPRGKVPMVWGAKCYMCSGEFVLKEIEVDHLTGNHSLTDLSDIQSFIEGIVLVEKDDLGLICKPCHKCKSLSEKQGISFKEALQEKEIIAIMKAKQDKEWLAARKVKPASNASARRKQIKQLMEVRDG